MGIPHDAVYAVQVASVFILAGVVLFAAGAWLDKLSQLYVLYKHNQTKNEEVKEGQIWVRERHHILIVAVGAGAIKCQVDGPGWHCSWWEDRETWRNYLHNCRMYLWE